ncbi:MAG: hypothetical protein FJX40_13580 [Alphaproteobacteria bacterium]|jgi:hypothetical protein|nr:hypothetical protein [Alphaproteobacteria bacterium]MBM3641786.1 hypothetical protein [Alphaproteobacteria bacterium]
MRKASIDNAIRPSASVATSQAVATRMTKRAEDETAFRLIGDIAERRLAEFRGPVSTLPVTVTAASRRGDLLAMLGGKQGRLMAEKVEFHKSVKGPLMETEDWWRLVIEDDGQRFVEHEWSYADPHKLASSDNSGTKRFAVDEFLASDAPQAVKDMLTKLTGS